MKYNIWNKCKIHHKIQEITIKQSKQTGFYNLYVIK